jgi:hypothetical protein
MDTHWSVRRAPYGPWAARAEVSREDRLSSEDDDAGRGRCVLVISAMAVSLNSGAAVGWGTRSPWSPSAGRGSGRSDAGRAVIGLLPRQEGLDDARSMGRNALPLSAFRALWTGLLTSSGISDTASQARIRARVSGWSAGLSD